MKIVNDLNKLNIDGRSAVVIGKFDGVHLGHLALLNNILEQKKNGLSTIVFTFTPSPAEFFGFADNKVLTTDSEKENILSKLGIDYLIEYPFNNENADILPETFIEKILFEKLKTAYIAAGEDLSFGKGGKGNMDLLKGYSDRFDFVVEKIEKIKVNNVIVSSSLIRNAVMDNDLVSAASYIGSPYFVSGIISHGASLGHTIGFPTINIVPSKRKILPGRGVYYSRTQIGEHCYNSITNVGVKPTVTDSGQMVIETYIYDFNENVYDQKATVSLLDFKRKEMQFSGIDELKAVLMKDIDDGKVFFGKSF